jgi:hypothetical protein
MTPGPADPGVLADKLAESEGRRVAPQEVIVITMIDTWFIHEERRAMISINAS